LLRHAFADTPVFASFIEIIFYFALMPMLPDTPRLLPPVAASAIIALIRFFAFRFRCRRRFRHFRRLRFIFID